MIVDSAPDWSEVGELALKSFCETAPDRLRARVVKEPSRPRARAARRRA